MSLLSVTAELDTDYFLYPRNKKGDSEGKAKFISSTQTFFNTSRKYGLLSV